MVNIYGQKNCNGNMRFYQIRAAVCCFCISKTVRKAYLGPKFWHMCDAIHERQYKHVKDDFDEAVKKYADPWLIKLFFQYKKKYNPA